MAELMDELRSLNKLLEEEKQALIQNDGDKVGEIVMTKEEYINRLSQFKGIDIENNKEVMKLIEEINSLQELNLLLTKQALSYQKSILESISKNINKLANTYSSKGSYEKENSVNLIDQSL